MPPTLSQNEVDALMDALEEGRIDTTSGQTESGQAEAEARPFDLTSRDRIVRGSMPMLDVINGRLARRLGGILADELQTEIQVTAQPAAPIKLGEFLSYQPQPSCINLISFPPLLGTGLLCIQPNLFFTMLNMVFGGDGDKPAEAVARDLTAIELDFARTLVERWASSAASAWAETHPLQPVYLATEISPEHVSIGAASDVVISTTFDVRLGEQVEGKFELAIPYASLEPIRSRLMEHPTEETTEDRQRWTEGLYQALLEVPLRLRVELGRSSMPLQQMLALRGGDVVRLNSHPQMQLPLFVAGRLKAEVLPVQANGNLAFRFEDWRSHD